VQNVRDGRLQNSPDWKANLNARYEANVTDNWLGFVQADLNYQSRVMFDISQDQELSQPRYATIGMSLGAKSDDGKYQITLFAKNLTDKAFALGMQRDVVLTNPTNPGNINFFTSKAANRYFGGTVRVNF
jgi:iron complex outermembrane receptor protein